MKMRHGWWWGLMLLVACGPGERERVAPSDDVPEQIITNYRTTRSTGGSLDWELWGASAEKFPGDARMHLTRIRMVFYQDGQPDAELTARNGIVDERTKDTEARGDVVLKNKAGRILRSEILYWDNDEEIIHTDQYVEIEDGDQIMTGIGLRTDPNLTDAVLEKSVEGVVYDENDPQAPEEQP